MPTPADHATSYDVVIVGGGHNGLTAAAYLARAGRSVLLLERSPHVGGATVSAPAFDGLDARLSRYSYLVSLLPPAVINDLGLRISLRRRRYSSYTPVLGADTGLLIDTGDPAATAASFQRVGAGADVTGWARLSERTGTLASVVWPSLTRPLPRRADLARALAATGDPDLFDDVFSRPLGELIERHLSHDLTRGVALTDGLIGTFAAAHEPDLRQNACFVYHVIGGGTGDWDVPVGGMGQVSDELARVAAAAGAQLRAGSEVTAVQPDRVTWRDEHTQTEHAVDARLVVWAAAPAGLDRLIGSASGPVEGAQVKVNLLLERLPRLRETVPPAAAFGGTFHINEGYGQLQSAFERACCGAVPDPLPAEIYCHSITDPTILGPQLAERGAHTMTVFALHAPHRLVRDLSEAGHEAMRRRLERAVLDSLNSVLAEPIEPVLATDSTGRPCVETKTTRDLEHALAMPGGNIFHGPLTWPFLDDDEPADTPARRWGVQSALPGVLLGGAGSRRGGGVSGLGGYHAYRAALELGAN